MMTTIGLILQVFLFIYLFTDLFNLNLTPICNNNFNFSFNKLFSNLFDQINIIFPSGDLHFLENFKMQGDENKYRKEDWTNEKYYWSWLFDLMKRTLTSNHLQTGQTLVALNPNLNVRSLMNWILAAEYLVDNLYTYPRRLWWWFKSWLPYSLDDYYYHNYLTENVRFDGLIYHSPFYYAVTLRSML